MDSEIKKKYLESIPKDMHWMGGKRATGRTTRMIAAVKEADAAGKAVYLVCAPGTDDYFKRVFRECQGVSIETATFHHSSMGNFNWETMQLRGAHQNCLVFVDHYCIERAFGAVLEEWHRYDEVPV